MVLRYPCALKQHHTQHTQSCSVSRTRAVVQYTLYTCNMAAARPLSALDGVHQALVVGRAEHVARGRVVAPLDLAQGDGHGEDLRLREHRALAVRLLPLLVVHVAVRVGLDLDEPIDVDVGPVGRNGARARDRVGTMAANTIRYTTFANLQYERSNELRVHSDIICSWARRMDHGGTFFSIELDT